SLETIAPFVKKYGGAVRNKKWVNLRTVKAHPNFMAKRLRTEFKRHEPTLVCAQPSVTKRILKQSKPGVSAASYAVQTPKHVSTEKKSNLSPGSILVVHRATHLSGKIVSVERYEPYIN